MPIDSVYDFTEKGLVEVKSWLEPWFLTRCPCAAATATDLSPFFDTVMSLAATRDLRGYWRLGDGGLGPYVDSSGNYAATYADMVRQTYGGSTAMTDLSTGALPLADDDGAVQFNDSAGVSDYLYQSHSWGTISSNPFDMDVGTLAGWCKPTASSSTFDGGIISDYNLVAGGPDHMQGYALGVAWPSRTVYMNRSQSSSPLHLTGPALTAGEWVFVCGVKDSTSSRLYLNGALVATGAAVNGQPGTNTNPKIGLSSSYGGKMFYGGIDEVSFWGDALTDDEIAVLAASGGLATDPGVRAVINVVGAYTASPGDVVLAAGTFTVTLPTAVGNSGSDVTVKNVSSGTITLAQTGSETIDGSTTDLTLAAADSVTVTSDGTGWQITSSYSYP